MTKGKAKSGQRRSKPASTAGRGARKPVDLDAVRQQISNLVGNQAVGLVKTTIEEADKGQYAAMKYLFELIGLYPAADQEVVPGDESLARTLLRRLGAREEVVVETVVTKDCSPEAGGALVGSDAVK